MILEAETGTVSTRDVPHRSRIGRMNDSDTPIEDRPIYLVEFVNGDDSFIAFGDDPWHLPVHKKTVAGWKRQEFKYPSCVRFMPYADEGPFETISRNELLARYGEQVSL